MSVRPHGTPRRHVVTAATLFAALIGAVVLTVWLGSGVLKAGQIMLLLLSPALLFAAVRYVPRGVRATRRRIATRRAEKNPQPTNPPIEEIAADLRRLLWQHDLYTRSTDIPMRARHLWALEAAITDCAMQAARALDVPRPDWSTRAGFDKPQLRRLLRALAAEGLVLPPRVGLLAPDNRV